MSVSKRGWPAWGGSAATCCCPRWAVTSGPTRPSLRSSFRPSWHVDAFDLPAGATELAVNEVCLQGFRAGPHAAVQFHPEATQPIVASWLANANPPPGQEATDPLFKGAEGAWQQASANAGSFFSAWLDGGLTRR